MAQQLALSLISNPIGQLVATGAVGYGLVAVTCSDKKTKATAGGLGAVGIAAALQQLWRWLHSKADNLITDAKDTIKSLMLEAASILDAMGLGVVASAVRAATGLLDQLWDRMGGLRPYLGILLLLWVLDRYFLRLR